ncbi:MAG: TonB-dependent receptor [Acidobacteria bacterium]|nr:TonB-dependent receptor [Acidobacteriota bacterium]
MRSFVLAAALCCAVLPAFAGEFGSVSGTVYASDGTPFSGAFLTISGNSIPAGRSMEVDSKGRFSLLRIVPGEYTLAAELPGFGSTKRSVVVSIDRDTQVDLTLTSTLTESIVVAAREPLVDAKSTEISSNFKSDFIEEIPVARTYKGLFELAPGVGANNRRAPNAGASRLDNTFLLDGVNVTNPHYGDIVPNVSGLDIAEVNIKRGAISAEFGRSGGMVVNAITKSGTNELAGTARYDHQPSAFVSDPTGSSGLLERTDRSEAGVSLGGAFVRDRLWFFGVASFPTATTTDRSNNLFPEGGLPDAEVDTDEYGLKLTAAPAGRHFLALSARSRTTSYSNQSIGASAHPSIASDDATDYVIATLGWTWMFSADSFAELKINSNREENSTRPVTRLGYRPAFDASHPELMGQFTTTQDRLVGGATAAGQLVGGNALAVNNQDFMRDELKLAFQASKEWMGMPHDFRTGITYGTDGEDLERRSNGWGTVTWNPSSALFTASYVSEQPPHRGRGESWGVFVQDQVTLSARATLTAGLLLNRDTYYGERYSSCACGRKEEVEILTFNFDQQIQPRIGIAFVPAPSVADKFYANYGRYMNTENKSLERAASPTRIFTTRATFDATGALLSDVPSSSTQSKTVDHGLDPQYTDEYVIGYSRPVGARASLDIWAIRRDVDDIFDDVSADGLGNGPFHVAQLPGAYRRYEAVTVELNGRFDHWRALALTAS